VGVFGREPAGGFANYEAAANLDAAKGFALARLYEAGSAALKLPKIPQAWKLLFLLIH
jgi:hypothetical protein